MIISNKIISPNLHIDLHPDNLTRDEALAAQVIIDGILKHFACNKIHKAGEGEPLPYEQSTLEVLMVEWGKASKKAMRIAIKMLVESEGKITSATIDGIMGIIETELKDKFPKIVDGQLTQFFDKAYKKAKRKVFNKLNMLIDWDEMDDAYIEWLDQHHKYWIGSYYDRILSDSLNGFVADGLREGLGREELGARLKDYFTYYPGIGNKPDAYWRGLAANGMNRARNFGLLKGYEELGITHLEVVAVMDERTSEICREMNGRIIPLIKAINQRDLLIAADNPEDVKTISPWLKIDAIRGLATSSIIDKGMIMPPYHFHCRTTVVERVIKTRIGDTFNVAIKYPSNIKTPLEKLKYRARERVIQREVA